jgi:hypothetical protein
MSLPSSLNRLIDQISNELNNLDAELSQAIKLVRERITLFPDNIASIQLFAILSNYALFTENARRRTQETIKYISAIEAPPDQDVQEAGEDLSEQLGRILESKIVVTTIKTRLEK